jgi:pilus assembly protein CpaE
VSRLVLVSGNTEFETRVREAFDNKLNGQFRYWRETVVREPSRAIAEIADVGAEVVVVGPDLALEPALELARVCDEERPDISVVIVAEPSANVLQRALHAGARDVIAPDVDDAELRAAFRRALQGANRRRTVFDSRTDAPTSTKRVVVVLCPKGGVGKTTISSNLAFGLAQVAPGEVAAIDLDLQFGDMASALRLSPEHSFVDAARAAGNLDAATLKVFLTPHRKDFFVLCAPNTPAEADDLRSDHIRRVLELLSESFKYVVVDTASGLDEAALVALEFATDLVLISATDVPSVRSTRKEIDALRVIGDTAQRWHFVLNRADARAGLEVGDIEATIGLNVDVAIPSSRAVPLSLNQGTPILEAEPRSSVARAIAQLVTRVAGEITTPEPVSNGASGRHLRRKHAKK